MKQDSVGQMIFSEDDVLDLLMQGREVTSMGPILVDDTVNIERAAFYLENIPNLLTYKFPTNQGIRTFDLEMQNNWHMPEKYKILDIAEYILSLCNNEAELQRCGTELLLYQERDLFNLLRYLKYLVDIMRENQVIWGVGRGSSVASYVLFKLGVHRIDSMYYNLAAEEFLR
jgi:DNA polymerase III alpha subunit